MRDQHSGHLGLTKLPQTTKTKSDESSIRTGSGSDRPNTQPSKRGRYAWLSIRPVATAPGSDLRSMYLNKKGRGAEPLPFSFFWPSSYGFLGAGFVAGEAAMLGEGDADALVAVVAEGFITGVPP